MLARLTSQLGDGMFQVGLASLFFFSATTSPAGVTAGQVAAAFAVMLLPFTLVGPWAGVFLDRWRRRQVLLVGNVVRLGLAVALTAVMASAGVNLAVYVLALTALSVNRLLLSAFSASLPHVVPRSHLLTANALVPTLGSIAAGLGGAVGLVTRFALPEGAAQDAGALACAAVAFGLAALAATWFVPDALGPDVFRSRDELRSELARTGRDLVAGARYLVARRTPAEGLTVVLVTRFAYGTVFIAWLLACRNLLTDSSDVDGGAARFGAVLAATGVGFALAVVLTPTLSRRTGPQRWIVGCLGLGTVAQVLVAVHLSLVTIVVAALLLGLAAQGAKIAVDTIVQRDTDDAFRGRAFALYDVLYNAGFVGAAALAAAALPDDGDAPVVMWALAALYAAGALVLGRWGTREPVEVPTPA
ncbi:MFS-type transporter involved in bile tolerance (Atg22 family) [Luteimicrobium subarcticum]|uniref:MFS-type transporter involved in bile tolerance (Atg22 family) n=2 Tax=Luteimicrobium subarcticum TaxID=620910 RepID=A0A2M8WJJ6_9MICO|nr:MFS-type transporter involved in bile tolerance (Atg22 family) [Luteimicrobium subarcticum]